MDHLINMHRIGCYKHFKYFSVYPNFLDVWVSKYFYLKSVSFSDKPFGKNIELKALKDLSLK